MAAAQMDRSFPWQHWMCADLHILSLPLKRGVSWAGLTAQGQLGTLQFFLLRTRECSCGFWIGIQGRDFRGAVRAVQDKTADCSRKYINHSARVLRL